MNREEKLKKLRELELEMLKLRSIVRSGGAVENPGRISQIRRDIARLKMALCEEGYRV